MARKAAQKVPSAGGQADEYETFSTALKQVLTVSHKDMQKRLTRSASDREAAAAKD